MHAQFNHDFQTLDKRTCLYIANICTTTITRMQSSKDHVHAVF